MDVIEQLSSLLECPCCYEKAKPDTTAVGICSNGHMTCESCGLQILKNRTIGNCPVCRQQTFAIIRGHNLAVSAIQILTSHQMFMCKHTNCNQQVYGNELYLHQQRCAFKPVQCPKTDCIERAPLQAYFEDHHPCVRVCNFDEQAQCWHVLMNLNYLYSFDTNNVQVSNRFKPITLKGVTSEGFNSSAYLNVVARLGMVTFYCGWLDQRDDVEEKYKHIKLKTHVYINTKDGRVGLYVIRNPKFEEEVVPHPDYCLSFNRETLFQWAQWANCGRCALSGPHVHVTVEIR